MTNQVSLKKKISAKTIIGNVKQYFTDRHDADVPSTTIKQGDIVAGQQIALMRVVGIASGVKSGNSTYGEWTAYKGEFRAVNLQTGEISTGSELFVPDVVQSLITPVVKKAEDSGTTVELAFDIGAVSNLSQMGYEYTAKPLMEISADASPAASLLERLNAANPVALPAPKADSQLALPGSDPAKAGKKK
jgi:hypothetical protein